MTSACFRRLIWSTLACSSRSTRCRKLPQIYRGKQARRQLVRNWIIQYIALYGLICQPKIPSYTKRIVSTLSRQDIIGGYFLTLSEMHPSIMSNFYIQHQQSVREDKFEYFSLNLKQLPGWDTSDHNCSASIVISVRYVLLNRVELITQRI